MMNYIDNDGAITPKGYEALQEAARAVKAARAHRGGRLESWYRDLARNSYTIDPRRPEPDERDQEREALLAAAREAVARVVDGGVLSSHDAKVRGWEL